jgi:hypothetical protein
MSNLNLTLHCGGKQVPRNALAAVHTPEPVDRWFPIPHDLLLDRVHESLAANDLNVVNEVHALARDGDHYFGVMQLASDEDSDFSTIVGLRNAHDKAFSAQMVVGSGVFVCDNLAFSGEIKIGRKHTRYIERDLPDVVHRAVHRIPLMREHQEAQIDTYKSTTIDDGEYADHLIMELFRKGIIAPSKIRAVWDEWKSPSHVEFTDGGYTVWRLFNAVTEVLKGRLAVLPGRTQQLHKVMDAACSYLEAA